MTEEKEKAIKGVSRREFIAGTVGGVVVGAVAGAAMDSLGFPKTVTASSQPTAVPQQTTGQAFVPTTWDKAADVVVCGSGAAGLPAALAAAEAGVTVILVESAKQLGGCAAISGGSLGIGGGNALQIKAGIVENADTIYSDLTQHIINYTNVETKTLSSVPVRSAPGQKNDPALARVFADRSLDTWNWLVAHGANFSGVTASTTYPGGCRASSSAVSAVVDPTGLGAKYPNSVAGGAGIFNPLIASVKGMSNVDIELNTRMTQIIRESPSSGRVLGIVAETALETMYFRANKAVILATGGWIGHPWLRTLYDPRMAANITNKGVPFCNNDGTGLMAALNINAVLTTDRNQDWHIWHRQWGTLYHVFSFGSPYAVPGLTPTNAGDYIFVNGAGTRFVDETFPETTGWDYGDPPYSFYDIALDQNLLGPYGTLGVWTIFDSAAATREKWNPTTWIGPTTSYPSTSVVDPNLVFSASTISGLATAINVDPNALTTTVNNYNSYVTAGADPDFGKPKSALAYQINTPPYYAVWCNIVLHDTCGGVAINAKSQVLDVSGNVIPGLYAGGEASGGLDVIGMPRGIIPGRVAGENAALEQSW